MEEKEWRRYARERQERASEMQNLKQQGWKSTGDLPYLIAPNVAQNRSRAYSTVNPNSVARLIPDFLKQCLEKEGEEYRDNNIKKVGTKMTFVSPDLFSKIEEKVKEYYASKSGV